MIIFLSFSGSYALNLYEEELKSDSVYFMDYHNNTPIVEKNIHKKRSPASLTKIMTFIIAYENSEQRDKTKVLVTQEMLGTVDPESSGTKLKVGEEVSITDLLNCMMISSSGYAAMALAYHIGGGLENFVNMMNEKALQIGCQETHFENPDGIYHENQYSTAFDMSKITKYAMKNPDFINIVSKSEYNALGDERDPVTTTNYLIDRKRGGKYYRPWVKGIKTGCIEDAGKCLISYASKEKETYLSIVMGGPLKDDLGNSFEDNMAMLDTVNLYDWAFENLKKIKLKDKYFPVDEVDVSLAWGRDKLILESDEDLEVTLPKDTKKEDISFEYSLPTNLEAPVEAGDVICKADIIYRGEKIGCMNLVSSETVKKSYFLAIFKILKTIFGSKIFIISASVILLLLASYIFYTLQYNRKRRKKEKPRKIINFKNPK